MHREEREKNHEMAVPSSSHRVVQCLSHRITQTIHKTFYRVHFFTLPTLTHIFFVLCWLVIVRSYFVVRCKTTEHLFYSSPCCHSTVVVAFFFASSLLPIFLCLLLWSVECVFHPCQIYCLRDRCCFICHFIYSVKVWTTHTHTHSRWIVFRKFGREWIWCIGQGFVHTSNCVYGT